MQSPKKGKKSTKIKEDYRPNMTIVCMLCCDKKSSKGSRNFKTFKVCADCVRYLESIDDDLDKFEKS